MTKKGKTKEKPKIKTIEVSAIELKKTDIKPEVRVIQPKKIEQEKKVKEEIDEFEDEFIEDNQFFDYPFMRRGPSLRIQPIAQQLEVELADIQLPKKEDENNQDQYRPVAQKDYSLNQKYELPGGTSYQVEPSQVSAPTSIAAASDPFLQQQKLRPSDAAGGYPGQQADRNYHSRLEDEAEKREKDKKRSQW